MAKLSAHGYELARLIAYHAVGAQREGDTTTGYTYTYSVRSDGHILRKEKAHGIHQRSNELYGRCPDHTWPWKLWRKTKSRKLPVSEVARIAGRLFSRAIVEGRIQVSGTYAEELRMHAEEKLSDSAQDRA